MDRIDARAQNRDIFFYLHRDFPAYIEIHSRKAGILSMRYLPIFLDQRSQRKPDGPALLVIGQVVARSDPWREQALGLAVKTEIAA